MIEFEEFVDELPSFKDISLWMGDGYPRNVQNCEYLLDPEDNLYNSFFKTKVQFDDSWIILRQELCNSLKH